MPGTPRAGIIPVTPFQQNCTLIWSDETKVGAVVYPGGDLDRIEAGYDNGVLRLVVPVAERAKPRKVEIAGTAPAAETQAIEA